MMTLRQMMTRFDTEDACKAHLVARRWPNGVRCPKCDTDKVTKLRTRPWNWICRDCDKRGYRFSPLVGTIFENSNIKLVTWFQVIFLMVTSKKGMSALQVHRTIGTGSYETAWYMCHRIRSAMKNDSFMKLSGVVEVDETYIGGKAKNAHAGNRGRGHRKSGKGRGSIIPPKTAVIGAIARKGNIVCQVIEETDRKTMQDFVQATVNSDVSLVATDEHQGYARLSRLGFKHDAVNHSAGEYVKETVVGKIHTANLDSFWSLLKRGIVGSFHKVSKDYLPLYVNEFAFRHNHRRDPDIFDAVLGSA
jgi:transposase-like protein